MLTRFICLVVLIINLLPASRSIAQVPGAPVVAVFEIESHDSGLKRQEIVALTDYLATRLGEGGRFLIVPRSEIKKRLVQQKKETYKSCYDQSCQVEIGRELAAKLTVSASISRIGSKCVVSAGMYDLQKAATIQTASAQAPCNADDLLEAIKKIGTKLAGLSQAQVEPIRPEPLPAKKPRPTPAPVLATKPVPASRLEFPGVSSSVSMLLSLPSFVGGDLENRSGVQFGFDLSLDFLTGSWFVYGFGLRTPLTPYIGVEIFFRAAAAIKLSNGLYLYPFVAAGISPLTSVQVMDEPNYTWNSWGFNVRGGLGLRWMWSSGWGLCIDAGAGFSSWSVYEKEAESGISGDEDGQAVQVDISTGIIFGW